MADAPEFAHGTHYGDDFGVTFYGGPTDGWWTDRLDISDRFIDPIFSAVLDLPVRGSNEVPRIVTEWNCLTGWMDATGRVLLSAADVVSLSTALGLLSAADLAPHCHGCSPDDCVRCAELIATFLDDRLASGTPLYVEDS